jgi:hypothetical protein
MDYAGKVIAGKAADGVTDHKYKDSYVKQQIGARNENERILNSILPVIKAASHYRDDGTITELKRGIDSLLEMEKKRAAAPAPKPSATPAPAAAPAAAPAPRPAPRPAARAEPKAEIKVEVKPESRTESRPEPKPAATPPRENTGPVRDGLVRYPPAPSDLPARNSQ